MSNTNDFLPYNKSDFFFSSFPYKITCDDSNKCSATDTDGKAIKTTDGTTTITVSKGDLDLTAAVTCDGATDNGCRDDYIKQTYYNKVLYNVLTGIQTSNSGADARYNDLAEKFNREIFGIYANLLGIAIILGIIYKL